MGLKDKVTEYVHSSFTSGWVVEDWDRVPTDADKLSLGNRGVRIEAAVLYADLRDSTALVKNEHDEFAAEVYMTYVHAAAEAIRFEGGTVTAYDGDRVMGVFVGGTRRNDAFDASCLLSAVVEDIIQPELNAFYGSSKYAVKQKVGIDSSTVLVTNSGIRGNNDYVWVGTAANNAAKLATIKRGYATYVTSEVYSAMKEYNLTAVDGSPLWTDLGSSDLGYQVYGSFARSVHIPN